MLGRHVHQMGRGAARQRISSHGTQPAHATYLRVGLSPTIYRMTARPGMMSTSARHALAVSPSDVETAAPHHVREVSSRTGAVQILWARQAKLNCGRRTSK